MFLFTQLAFIRTITRNKQFSRSNACRCVIILNIHQIFSENRILLKQDIFGHFAHEYTEICFIRIANWYELDLPAPWTFLFESRQLFTSTLSEVGSAKVNINQLNKTFLMFPKKPVCIFLGWKDQFTQSCSQGLCRYS